MHYFKILFHKYILLEHTELLTRLRRINVVIKYTFYFYTYLNIGRDEFVTLTPHTYLFTVDFSGSSPEHEVYRSVTRRHNHDGYAELYPECNVAVERLPGRRVEYQPIQTDAVSYS